LQYTASAETKTLLNKYGFVLRMLQDGFELYTSSNQSLETHLNYIAQVSGKNSFEFVGTTTNPNFYNFTAIPMNELGVLTYSSDQTSTDTSSDTILLTETFVSGSPSQYAVKINIKFDDIIRLQKTINYLNYNIQLKSRQTQWNYYIINNSNQQYNQLEIQSTNENIEFSEATEATLQNGQKALLFKSKTTKIPLKNEVTYKLDLINTLLNIT